MDRYGFSEDHKSLSNQKIKFLSGLQSNLNSLILNGGAVEGAFYLTTDTHRLYIGRTISSDNGTVVSKTIPIPVNEGISTVATLDELNSVKANPGEFYYISGLNILAVKAVASDGASSWVQLNNDTNDTIEVTTATLTKKATQSQNDRIEYNLVISQKKKNNKTNAETALTNVESTVTFLKSDIINSINVGIGSAAVPTSGANAGKAVISLNGDGADTTKSVTLSGAGSVALSGTANNIVITGTNTTYDLTSAAGSATISLTDSNNQSDEITFEASGENIAIDSTASAAGKIVYKHTGAGNASGGTFGNNGTSVDLGGSIKVPKITKDANGHIKTIEDVTINVSDNEKIKAVGVSSEDASKIVITTQNDRTITSTNKDLFYNIQIDDDATSSPRYNQADLGHFYSASKVDELIANAQKSMNAMTYKGTVGSSGSTVQSQQLPQTNVEIGDTYLVDYSGSIYTGAGGTGAVLSNKGDLYIATISGSVVEDANGKIPSGSVTWTRVEAGDVDTTYTLAVDTSTDEIVLTPSTGNQQKIKLNGDSYISVDATAPGNVNTITVSHNDSGATAGSYGLSADNNTSGSSTKISVPYFTVDQKGHITSATTHEYALPTEDTYTVKNNGTSIILEDKNNSAVGHGSVEIEAGSGLTATGGTNKITIAHASGQPTDNYSAKTAAGAEAQIIDGGLVVVKQLTTNNTGHVTAIEYEKYSLPTAAVYELKNSALSNGASWTLTRDSANVGDPVTLTSDSLTFTQKKDSQNNNLSGQYDIDLVWGSF